MVEPTEECPASENPTLGELRVLAGELGLSPEVFADQDEDAQRESLVQFIEGVAQGLKENRMSLESYLDVVGWKNGAEEPNVVQLPAKRRWFRRRGEG